MIKELTHSKKDSVILQIDDELLTALGNTNITYEQCFWEAFNNSIQEAENRDLDLDVTIEMHWAISDPKKIEKIIHTQQNAKLSLA